jgi:hypothetical protein
MDESQIKLKIEQVFSPKITHLKPPNLTYSEQYLSLACYGQEKAVKHGRIDIITAYELRGYLPSVYHANVAVARGYFKIVEWMIEKGIELNELGALFSIERGNIEALNWLEKRNILPDVFGANQAVNVENIEILNWCAKRGILPDLSTSHIQIYYHNKILLSWLKDHNCNKGVIMACPYNQNFFRRSD